MKLLFEKFGETESVVVFSRDPIGTLIIDRTHWETLGSPSLITTTLEPGDHLRDHTT